MSSPRLDPIRAEHEISHGKKLAEGDPELTWGWATPAGRQRASRRALLIAKAASLEPGATALEIGCGTGLFTEMFALSGARIIAVDISRDLLERARTRELPPERVRFLERRVEACRLDDPEFDNWVKGGFDAVIGSSVLHHLDLRAALASFWHLLKPGGRLSFAEPNLLNPQVFMERYFRRFFPYVSADEWAIVRWKLRADLESIGFTDVSITPFDWLHPATPPRVIPLVSSIGHIVERVPGVREFAGSVLIHARRR